MSISNEVQNLQTNLEDSYTAVSDKGGTLPQNQCFDNLPTAINTITELNGTTLSVTENGTYTPESPYNAFSSVEVDVSGGGGDDKFFVQVIDYDGTILKSDVLKENDTFTLPENPTHTGLTFQGWSSPVTITNNTVTVGDSDITIGATYQVAGITPASGLSEFDISLTPATSLTVTLSMDGTKNWGDGTSDTSTSHTYASIGDYTITCDGTTMTNSSTTGIMGDAWFMTPYTILTAVRLANVTNITNYAFKNCTALKSITLSNDVTTIGDYAFLNCASLTSITIPSSVTTIGNYAFRECASLTSIIIPSSVTSIGTYAFYTCRSLNSITIPSSVTSIGSYAFYNCYSLSYIAIPNGITSIGDYAFLNCASLNSITIPSSVTSIGSQTFYGCYSLNSITIPSSVTSIGSYAFLNFSRKLKFNNTVIVGIDSCPITSITIPDGVTKVSISNCPIASITLPSTVTSVGLNKCPITSITIPDGVTMIALSECNLKSVTIPSSVRTIGNSAFRNNGALLSVTFAGTVSELGAGAFMNNYSVLEYDFTNCTSIPTLTNNAVFQYINSNCKIKVPASLETNWKAATNWSTYKNHIIGV